MQRPAQRLRYGEVVSPLLVVQHLECHLDHQDPTLEAQHSRPHSSGDATPRSRDSVVQSSSLPAVSHIIPDQPQSYVNSALWAGPAQRQSGVKPSLQAHLHYCQGADRANAGRRDSFQPYALLLVRREQKMVINSAIGQPVARLSWGS